MAYRLSQSYTVGRTTYDGSVWGQTIGIDNHPVLGGKKVYATTGCVTYNNDGNTNAKEHNYTFTADAHSCIDCGFTESHTLGENNQCTVCKTYAISNADQLYWFADQVKNNHTNFKNAIAVLTADITVNTGVLQSDGSLADDTSSFRSWTPIGYSDLRIYTGTFDGQGHTVSGLYFNDSSANFVGLFGCAGTSSSVSNVGVMDSYFNGNSNVGGVCGYSNGKITNCYNQATVNGSDYVGGVCGEAGPGSTSKITSCYNVGIVKGKTYTACVVGYADSGKVSNCYYSGEQTEDDLPVITQPVIPIDPIITLTTTTTYRKITISRNTTTTTTTTTTTRETPGIVIPSLTTTSTSTQTPSVPTQATGDEQATPKTPEQFASGEVAYLLNGSTSEGTLAWGQRIGEDDFPVIDGTKRVYKLKKTYCDGSNIMDITGQPVYIYANSSTYILHSMTDHPAKEPTCTEAGNYAYWTCGYEKGVYYKNEAGIETFANLAATVIPAHGHDMTEHSANAATCTEAGNYAYWTCSYENGVYYKIKDGTDTFANLAATVIPAHGHDMTEHSANAATCTNSGNYAYWTCSYENGVYYKDEARTDTFANLEATVIPALEHEDTDNDGYCNNGCGLPVRPIVKEVSATLNGDIGLNYYIALPESVASDEGAYVQFTVNGQTTEVYLKDLTAEEDGTYKVTCWLTAKEMRDNVTFELYDGSGTNVDIYKNSGEKIEGAAFDYSLETYFDALSSDEDAALKALADATLIYGAYAQNAFNHNTNPTLNGSELADVTVDTLETNKMSKSADIPEGLKLTEMTLILETETTLRLYFKSESIDNYTFKLDGSDVTLSKIEEESLYYVEIANISAKNLDTNHTLEINGDCTLTFNALSYAYAVLKTSNNDDLCNVVKALYKYNEAANAYFSN